MASKTSSLSFRLLVGAALLSAGLAAPATSFAVDTGGNGGGSSNANSVTRGPTLADARAQIKGRHWDKAIALLKQIVAASPNNADALNLLGFSLRKSGNMKSALGFYLKALKIEPNHKGANEYLGELYVETGQLAKAQERLKALATICGNTSCEEYQDLKKVIDKAA